MPPSLLLTKLPLELRTLIWEFTLQVPPTNTNDKHGIVWLTPDPRPRPSVLNLLLTCRHIKREAEDIFYRINNLAIEISDPLATGPGPARDSPDGEASVAHFLKSLSPRRLSSINALCIWLGGGYLHLNGKWHFGCRELHTTCKRLRRLPNLRTLHLMLDLPTELPPEQDSHVREGLHHVWREHAVSSDLWRIREGLDGIRRSSTVVPEPLHCCPPALRQSDKNSGQEPLESVFDPTYQETFKAVQLLRQVEEVTVWGRDAFQEDDPWLGKAMQTYLPRYRAKNKLEWLYSDTIKGCRYMCSRGCESLDCEHLK
ncbi:hypothetical protein Q7P35_009999 [Cladosporium inversicolor]